jgi:glycerol uptake facilitator-like aquaporin
MDWESFRIPIGRRVDAFLNPCYVGEFIGTFMFILTICVNVAQGTPLAPLSIGAILMCLVYATGEYVHSFKRNSAIS